MAPLTQIPTDTWVSANWDEYCQVLDAPEYASAKVYYFDGKLRIEMNAVGPDHSRDKAIVTLAISLFGLVRGIPLNALINCSYQKIGLRGCQPDVSYYIESALQLSRQSDQTAVGNWLMTQFQD